MIIPDLIQDFNIGTWSIQTIKISGDSWFQIENYLGKHNHVVQINYYDGDKFYWIELINKTKLISSVK